MTVMAVGHTYKVFLAVYVYEERCSYRFFIYFENLLNRNSVRSKQCMDGYTKVMVCVTTNL